MTAYKYIISTLGFQPHQVLVHGYSLGSAVATRLVLTLCTLHQSCPAALLLEAPFLSIADVVRDRIGVNVSSLLYHHFPTKEILGDIPVPVVIVHGTRDRVVPFNHGAALASRYDPVLAFCAVDGAGHMTSFSHETAKKCIADVVFSRKLWPHSSCWYMSSSLRFKMRWHTSFTANLMH
ncbi:hypothetical protein AC1031_019385 [Aphanomyces cochlioides]|nr:hypothetical protein AC1031_019385 [Aphanomyces cochlioides]